jgi:hypothetical protein
LQATHICINRYTPKTLSGLVSVAILPPTLLVLASKPTSAGAIALSIAGSFLTYWLALAASTCAYRLSPFHPLAKYPGPVLAKLSRFWTTKLILDGDQHTTYHALHERYGEIVRTGPNHLIIRNVSAVPTVLGPGKGMWHNGARTLSYLPVLCVFSDVRCRLRCCRASRRGAVTGNDDGKH